MFQSYDYPSGTQGFLLNYSFACPPRSCDGRCELFPVTIITTTIVITSRRLRSHCSELSKKLTHKTLLKSECLFNVFNVFNEEVPGCRTSSGTRNTFDRRVEDGTCSTVPSRHRNLRSPSLTAAPDVLEGYGFDLFKILVLFISIGSTRT